MDFQHCPAQVTEGVYNYCVALLDAQRCMVAPLPYNTPARCWDLEQVGIFSGEQPAAGWDILPVPRHKGPSTRYCRRAMSRVTFPCLVYA